MEFVFIFSFPPHLLVQLCSPLRAEGQPSGPGGGVGSLGGWSIEVRVTAQITQRVEIEMLFCALSFCRYVCLTSSSASSVGDGSLSF